MFDVKGFLRRHAKVQNVYGDEHVIQCDCDRRHGSREWHLWVNVKKGKGHCYRCHRNLSTPADVVRFVVGCTMLEALAVVREASSASTRLREAVADLMPDEGDAPKLAVVQPKLPEEFVRYRSPKTCPPYLLERMTHVQAKYYGAGWCESGYYANRVVVPVRDVSGRLVSFVARWMSPKPPKGTRKVLYPKGSKVSLILWNERKAACHNVVVITEGIFDALRVGAIGVALFGKHASREQVRRLSALGARRRLVVMLDPDAEDDAAALADELADLCLDVRMARLPKGRKDPGGCSRAELRHATRAAVRWGRSVALSRLSSLARL